MCIYVCISNTFLKYIFDKFVYCVIIHVLNMIREVTIIPGNKGILVPEENIR